MALDIDKVFEQGGEKLIGLLQYAVRAAHADLLFIFLAREYQQSPSTSKAVALYRFFCVPNAPARLTSPDMLPPLNPGLAAALRPLEQSLWPPPASSGAAAPKQLPPRYLFDAVAAHTRENSTTLKATKRSYRFRKSAVENLPGGRMTEGQRYFVDKIWRLNLRPALVAAGFWRVGAIG